MVSRDDLSDCPFKDVPGRSKVNQQPQCGQNQSDCTGNKKHMLPIAQQPHQPGYNQRGDDGAQGSADSTETVSRSPLSLLEPKGDSYQLSSEYCWFCKSKDAAAKGEYPDIGGQAAPDASKGPDSQSSENDLFRAEPVNKHP